MNSLTASSIAWISRMCAVVQVLLVSVATVATAEPLPHGTGAPVVFVAGTSTGSQGLTDLGTPTVNTGNIDTATTFTIGDLYSTSSRTGYFASSPPITLLGSALSFTVGNNTSFSFSNPGFGSFASTSIIEETSGPGFRTFLMLGTYSSGTSFASPVTPSPADASLRISFTQTPVGTGAITDSATLAIPPVPEPSTLVLACVGIAGGLMFQQSRRRPASGKAAAPASPSSSTVAG